MHIAIRDDDTNYLTDPDILERTYGEFWDEVPVTLACVPVARTQSEFTPVDFEGERQITENGELVTAVQEHAESGRVEVALHGYDHTLINGDPEFVGAGNPAERIENGKSILQEFAPNPIDIFVPPHVRLSRSGAKALADAGFSIVRGRGPRPREIQFSGRWLWQYSHVIGFYLRAEDADRYPSPVDYDTHTELYCYRVNEYQRLPDLKRGFDLAHQRGAPFVLSTHASRLSKDGERILTEIINYALERGAEGKFISNILD